MKCSILPNFTDEDDNFSFTADIPFIFIFKLSVAKKSFSNLLLRLYKCLECSLLCTNVTAAFEIFIRKGFKFQLLYFGNLNILQKFYIQMLFACPGHVNIKVSI